MFRSSSTDDLFALQLLYRYASQGRYRLLGVVVDRMGDTNAAIADLMNNYYGFPSLPIALERNGTYERFAYINYTPIARATDDNGHLLFVRTYDDYSSLPDGYVLYRSLPGGACGYMGACGAAISTGIFMSVVTRNTPLSTETWQLCNLMTARALEQVALNGGPRCCKRDSYLSGLTAVDFVKEHLGVEMEKPEVRCSRSRINNQCIGKKCPFSPE